MAKFLEKLRSIGSKPHQPLPSGFYVYHTPEQEPDQFRLHLRVEPDGEGVLIVNASSILHLNQTATEFAYDLIQGKTEAQIIEMVAGRFDAAPEIIAQDVASFHQQLLNFVKKSDQEPIANFGFEPTSNYQDISAPYRLNCCLTYRTESLNADLPEAAIFEELDTDAWKSMIKKSFDAGIPHLVFYGGEPTLRDDLIPLLQYCEELGLVTGLVSSGRKLTDEAYIESLLASGLDHLLIPYDPEDTQLRAALTKILPLDLYTCVGFSVNNTTEYPPLIDQLIELGTNAFSLVPAGPESYGKYLEVAEYINNSNAALVGDLPLPAAQVELVKARNHLKESLQEAEYVILEVKPDGEVYSSPVFGHRLGNLLEENWQSIWDRRFQEQP
ncbi:MAG: PqqD family peptide modification chaperone [Anaerolineaceae bacterium]